MIYCLDCRYCLYGLREHRCPECGRGFDPEDSTTYSATVKKKRSRVAVALMYVGPAVLVIFLYTLSPGRKVQAMPPEQRVIVTLVQLAGPFSFLMSAIPAARCCFFIVVPASWMLWIGFILSGKSQLEQVPLYVHLAIACLWCGIGCCPLGLYL